MKITTLHLSLMFSLIFLPAVRGRAQEAPRGSITIDRIADIKYPTDQLWSPDGKTVAFLWDAAGKQDLYMAQAGSPPVALTDFPVDPDILTSNIGHYEWLSADTILFTRDAGLMTVSTKTQRPARFPGFQGAMAFSLSNDKKQIAFVRAGQVWVGNIEAKTERQLTRINDGSRVSGPSFSPDGMWVTFTTGFSSEAPEPMPYNGNRLVVMRSRNWGSQLGIVSVFSGDPVMVAASGGGGGGGGGGGRQWAVGPDGPVLVREEFSGDRKNREIVETNVKGESHTIWKDYDPAWWSLANGARTVISPDGKMIAFMSDRTGWAHLYVIPTDATSEKQARQLSKGDFGDCFATWSPDSKRIAFAHSEVGNQQERFISIVDAASGKVQPVVTSRGVNYDPVFSADGTKLAYLRSAAEHPQEVYTVDIAAAKPVRLTDSLPEGLNPADLTAPIAVHYPSRKDAKPVPATLMLGKNFDKTIKHPAIIWIHGSGADQNYLAWHPGSYRMYYSVCQYFAQQGYVILTPDYRGSSGYSREWTTGAFNDLGGGETQDVNGGADYLKTLSYVDPDRIGVWGLSYGGFMTLQSIITAPKLFAAAIDVAGVGDWETWTTGGALLGRLGSTPVSDPGEYDRSAPVKHLDKIERPLLILQGTNDTNVPLWETLKVVDRLEKLGTPFDMAFYPGEIHFFRRAFVLRDAWRRSEAFFDLHLKAPAVPLKSSDAVPPDKIAPEPNPSAVEAQ
jgi:Tol biopolymer transport system component/dienelactone hydrolase